MHDRLARTLRRRRGELLKQRIRDWADFVADLDEEEYRQVWRDLKSAAKRRRKRAVKEPRGEARRARLEEVLVEAVKELARTFPRDYMPGVRLFHQKTCKRIAAHLPPEARRLFKRKRVSWRTIRKYTAAVADWSRYDLEREALAAEPGLLRHFDLGGARP